jgi:hypothetical protein
LKEHDDRAKHVAKGCKHGLDRIPGRHWMCNQIEQCEAHDQEDDDPLYPHHVGRFILPVFIADYSNTLPHVQANACILSFLPDPSADWEQARRLVVVARSLRFRPAA